MQMYAISVELHMGCVLVSQQQGRATWTSSHVVGYCGVASPTHLFYGPQIHDQAALAYARNTVR